MDQTSTQTDLLRLIYQETDRLETSDLLSAIEADPVIKQEFNELLALQGCMDKYFVSPSETAVHNVISHIYI